MMTPPSEQDMIERLATLRAAAETRGAPPAATGVTGIASDESPHDGASEDAGSTPATSTTQAGPKADGIPAGPRQAGVSGVPAPGSSAYRYVRPMRSVAESLIEVYRNTEGRWMTGLNPIDLMMRGVGKGELCYVTGRTHSGKTQVVLHGLIRNLDRPQVLFTPDETSELVLAKLLCWMKNINAERVEALVKAGDPKALAAIRRLAAEDLPNLLVVDNVSDLGAAEKAMREAENHFGRTVEAVILDYLALFGDGGGEYGDVAAKSREVKRWIKDLDKPGIVIHQGTRSNAGKGQVLGLEAMSHAGENEAIFVVGVRRKRDDEKLEDFEREKHTNTVTVSVIKNKRPPSKRGSHDFYLDPDTGRIREINDATDWRRERHDQPPPPRRIVDVALDGQW